MNNRSLFGGLLAILLVTLLCICGVGAFFLGTGANAFALLSPTNTGQVPLSQPTLGEAQATVVPAEDTQSIQQPPARTEVERQPIQVPPDALAIVQAEEEVLAALYENVSPSVVNITVGAGTNAQLNPLGQGSGFVYDTEGHIVTNNHVVEGAESVNVTFNDGLQLTAEIVGTDPDSDLAVLRVEAEPGYLRPIPIANSSDLRVGESAIAIGNPFGFAGTMTIGIVSALGRTVPDQAGVPGQPRFSLPNLIQTDTAINPGNSGGPLLDVEGRVIGVNTLIYSSTQGSNSGVGFAIPANKVSTVVPALIADGVYQTPYLGIQTQGEGGMTPELAELLDLENVTFGLLVVEVTPGGPADEGGLRGNNREIDVEGQPIATGGDVIIAIDGQEARDFDDLINYLDTKAVGDVVTLTVIRDGEQVDVPVTLGARP
jgi:S1-C subfamily serine protease